MATDMYRTMQVAFITGNRKEANMSNQKIELKLQIDETKDLIVRGRNAHAFMKQVNKHYRKHGTCRGFHGMTEEKAKELDAQTIGRASCPFDSRELEKSNSDLGRLKVHLMKLQDQQTEGSD